MKCCPDPFRGPLRRCVLSHSSSRRGTGRRRNRLLPTSGTVGHVVLTFHGVETWCCVEITCIARVRPRFFGAGGHLAFWCCNHFCNHPPSQPSHPVQRYAKPSGGVSSSKSSELRCLRGDLAAVALAGSGIRKPQVIRFRPSAAKNTDAVIYFDTYCINSHSSSEHHHGLCGLCDSTLFISVNNLYEKLEISCINLHVAPYMQIKRFTFSPGYYHYTSVSNLSKRRKPNGQSYRPPPKE